MNGFWIKAAGIVIVVAVIGAFVMWIRSGIKEAQNPERTFSDMVKQDREEINAEPNANDLSSGSGRQQAREAGEPATSAQPAEQPQPVTFYFTQLDETEQVEAENRLAMIPTGQSIGRLPMTGYNLMVDTCRQIIERWPGSIYDYKARRSLGQIPERYRSRYNITDEELDLTHFTKPRPNTTPYTIEEKGQ
jgi:hypothetical protein